MKAILKTINYDTQSKNQVMDIYRLPNFGQKTPVLVLVHGGAFKFGDQKMPILQPIIDMGLERGYTVASIDYRKTTEVIFPEPLVDVKQAIRFLKENAVDFGIDATKFYIWGESAGAYLALMTALTPLVKELNGNVTNVSDNPLFTGLVCFYPPVYFYKMKEHAEYLNQFKEGFGRFESDLMGVANIFDSESDSIKANWQTYREFLPESFQLKVVIQVGDSADKKVPYLQSVDFAEDVANVSGINCWFKQINGATHEDAQFYETDNLKQIFDFLQST